MFSLKVSLPVKVLIVYLYAFITLCESQVSGLQFPFACPSYDYVVPNRRVTIKSVGWNDGEGTMLPLQHYHARREVGEDDSSLYSNLFSNSTKSEGQLTLQAVLNDVDAYDLSHSSRSMLVTHTDLSPSQKTQLLRKIKAEQRASQPIPLSALRILYCDAHICVVNKPSGVLSVPGPRRNPSLANLVYDVMRPDIDLDQMIVHRLDMATSGILIYALSLEALSKLHSDFKNRRVQKSYQCLVHGRIQQQEGEIDVDLERDIYNPPFMRIAQPKSMDDALLMDDSTKIGVSHKFFKQAPKESLTTWSVEGYEYLHEKQAVSRLNLRPWTGRTHQLRVHCARALGASIVGDDIYGPSSDDSSLCLHAKTLHIYHPISGAPMIFQADTPF
jgi:23S rRNA-/tRNA-specific pseudouridylate synthase